jgi:Spy/CpxP family protein refolding chaperone
MKRIVSMWAILILGLFIFGGLAIAQEEEEEATEGKIVETQITKQMPPSCQLMMQPMAGMMPGMMGPMCQGPMSCGMMGGKMGSGMNCCGMMPSGMMGCGKMCGMGQGGMQCGMGCGSCCEQLHQLGCPSHFMEMAGDLELSEEQATNLKAICAAHKKDVIRKQADLKVAKMELNELVGLPNADLAKVKAKITEIGSMKQSMCLAQLATIEKAHKVLTTEQMKKFNEMKRKMSCPTGKAGMMPKVKKYIKMKVEE